jgi:hypothetical protein
MKRGRCYLLILMRGDGRIPRPRRAPCKKTVKKEKPGRVYDFYK